MRGTMNGYEWFSVYLLCNQEERQIQLTQPSPRVLDDLRNGL